MIPWTTVMAQNWPCAWLRSPEDTAAAASQIRQQLYGGREPRGDNDAEQRNGELVAAIYWLAGPENRLEKCPTVRQLIRAVCIRRKAAREQDAPPSEGCPICRGNGWATYWPEWQQDWGQGDYMMAYAQAAPCGCSAGVRVTGQVYEGKDGMTEAERTRLRGLTDAAVAQWRARESAR